jgi:glycosyltransferase involved in cell wall biosynthesis
MDAGAARPLTVSLITGVIIPRDAISNVCREQLEALARYGRLRRRRLDLKVYALRCDMPDSRIVTVSEAAAVAADPHFQTSDLILYHFGIYYPLFDSILLAPRTARTVVTFYGITHPGLLGEGVRDSLYRSFQQAVNLHAADRILITSQFLAQELERMRVPAERITPILLPASFERLPDPDRRQPPTDELRLMYVGRFVSAKGIMDLVKAVHAFRGKVSVPVRLDLVGSATFSDPSYLAGLREFVTEHGLGDAVHFHHDIGDGELSKLLLAADALVIPSYHEGFCVPVIEAMACGCFVICSDAGALPETSGGLGRLFAVRDVRQLAERLAEFARARAEGGYMTETGFLPRAAWQARARTYSAGFTRARFQERFWAAVLDDLTLAEEEVRGPLAAARAALVGRLRSGEVTPPDDDSAHARVVAALASAGPTDTPQARAG